MVYHYLRNASSNDMAADGPNEREINDVLFNANLLDFMRLYMIKRRIVNKIHDDLYIHEQSIDLKEITMDVAILIREQEDLKVKLNMLLAIESFISGLYSGLSTCILKIIVGLITIKQAFEHEGEGTQEERK